jgi:hypothetical protein
LIEKFIHQYIDLVRLVIATRNSYNNVSRHCFFLRGVSRHCYSLKIYKYVITHKEICLIQSVRVYLLDYIFYIIDCYICRDIFGRIDIIYCRLSYIFRGVLPLKTLVLYIYRLRGTMQNNQHSYPIYSPYMVSD